MGEWLNPTAHRDPHASFAHDDNVASQDVNEPEREPAEAEGDRSESVIEAVSANPHLEPETLSTSNSTRTRISFPGTNFPQVEPLERLLEDLWSYFKTQEALIADEKQALQTLQQRVVANQQWIHQYESRNRTTEEQTAHEFNLERHRSRCFHQELQIYRQIRELREQKVNSLESNRSRIAMLLDSLRSELLKIDSFCTSIDTRFAPAESPSPSSEQYVQEQIETFRQSFDEARTQERQTIADFNARLTQLTEA